MTNRFVVDFVDILQNGKCADFTDDSCEESVDVLGIVADKEELEPLVANDAAVVVLYRTYIMQLLSSPIPDAAALSTCGTTALQGRRTRLRDYIVANKLTDGPWLRRISQGMKSLAAILMVA